MKLQEFTNVLTILSYSKILRCEAEWNVVKKKYNGKSDQKYCFMFYPWQIFAPEFCNRSELLQVLLHNIIFHEIHRRNCGNLNVI